MAKGRSKLTGKQEAFCIEYVKNGGNASDAYRRAYNAGNMTPVTINRKAFDLINNGKITARVKELTKPIQEKAEKNLGLTREWVLKQLAEVVSMAKAAEPVLNNEGQPMGEYRTNLAAANKALELIGKEVAGMFVDRKEIRTGLLDNLTPEQVDEIERALTEIEVASAASQGGITH